MAKCPMCNSKKGKRVCKLVKNQKVCSLCCGTTRNTDCNILWRREELEEVGESILRLFKSMLVGGMECRGFLIMSLGVCRDVVWL